MIAKSPRTLDPVHILIAEDSRTQAEHLRYMLEEQGYTVIVARNGKAALAEAHASKPDLVISDVVMPEMSGYALCRALKSDDALKDVPVILVTSMSRPQDVIEGLNSGADNFITKPYDEKYLLARVSYLLTNRLLRSSGEMRTGLEIDLNGKRHFVTAERQQIVDLLISTYAAGVRLNDDLQAREKALRNSYEMTKLLYQTAERLNRAESEAKVVEEALQGCAEVPFVRAAWIWLLEPGGGVRATGSVNLPEAAIAALSASVDCRCRQEMRADGHARLLHIDDCAGLAAFDGDDEFDAAHVSVPLVGRDGTRGLLNVMIEEARALTEAETTILSVMGHQISAALDRAQLHDDLERKVVERTAQLEAEIAERRVAEAQLHHAQKMEALGNLTGGIAHDFNNMLAIVIGNLDLLGEKVAHDREFGELLDAALNASIKGAELTTSLLAFARKQPLQPRLLDPNALVSNGAKLLGRTLGEEVRLELDLQDGLWPVKADPAQLESAMFNLAINAKDAMPSGGTITIGTANITLDDAYVAANPDAVPGDYILLVVRDTGDGIPPEVLSRVFEPFFTTKAPGKGTGLGLAMVFGFAKQSGGHTRIESEVGRGTTIEIYLPRAAPDGNSDGAALSDAAKISAPASECILVVEDNPMVRDVVIRQLIDIGYRVAEADSAARALDLIDRIGGIDLVFSDIVMPGGMTGVDLAARVKQKWPGVKVLLTSGFPQGLGEGASALPAGVELLSKPYRKQQLAARLRGMLDS